MDDEAMSTPEVVHPSQTEQCSDSSVVAEQGTEETNQQPARTFVAPFKANRGLGALLGQLRDNTETATTTTVIATREVESEILSDEVENPAEKDIPKLPLVDSKKTQTRGLGALLGQLRHNDPSASPVTTCVPVSEEIATCTSALEEVSVDSSIGNTKTSAPDEEMICEADIDLSKLNRKERRAMMLKLGTLKRSDPTENSAPEAKVPRTEHLMETRPSLDYSFQNPTVVSIREPFSCKASGSTGFIIDNVSFRNNFVKSVRCSPSGRAIFTNSQDNCLRIFTANTIEGDNGESCQHRPTYSQTTSIPQGGFVYDAQWYPSSECDMVATTSIGRPIHVYNTSGERTVSFRGINHLDELEPAFCLSWMGSSKIAGGYGKGLVRFFDVNRPGRAVREERTWSKNYGGPRGKLSALCSDRKGANLVAGSFSGTVSLWNESMGMWSTHLDVVTSSVQQVMYGRNNEYLLYVACQKNDAITCFDLRLPEKPLFSLMRPCRTDQRIFFDIDRGDRWLVSGSSTGAAYVYDLKDPSMDPVVLPLARCTVAGVSFHPETSMVVACSGERVFPTPMRDPTEDVIDEDSCGRHLDQENKENYRLTHDIEKLENGVHLVHLGC